MTIQDLEALVLASGSHSGGDGEVCFIEAATAQDDLPFSDRPPEYCAVLAAFGRRWNDDLDKDDRQMLKRFLDDGNGRSRLFGTGNDGYQDQRAWMCADWLARVHTPAWLDLAGVTESAATLRALPPIVDAASGGSAQPSMAAAGAAARAAARDAAWDAAWDAARDAAWAAAGAAARAAVRAAAGAAAWDAAWDAARDAAWAAAGAAAGDALKPTTVSLQKSALDLMDAMLALGADERVSA